MAKIDFWPNLDLSDLDEYGLGLPQYPQPIPNKPFSWRIQSIKKLLPAWCALGHVELTKVVIEKEEFSIFYPYILEKYQ